MHKYVKKHYVDTDGGLIITKGQMCKSYCFFVSLCKIISEIIITIIIIIRAVWGTAE